MTIDVTKLQAVFDGTACENETTRSPLYNYLLGEVLAVAAFKMYIESDGTTKLKELEGIPKEASPAGINPRSKKKLDRWLKASNGQVILYQTEIKNWTAKSLGGERPCLPPCL